MFNGGIIGGREELREATREVARFDRNETGAKALSFDGYAAIAASRKTKDGPNFMVAPVAGSWDLCFFIISIKIFFFLQFDVIRSRATWRPENGYDFNFRTCCFRA
jgi:hypothetical protein